MLLCGEVGCNADPYRETPVLPARRPRQFSSDPNILQYDSLIPARFRYEGGFGLMVGAGISGAFTLASPSASEIGETVSSWAHSLGETANGLNREIVRRALKDAPAPPGGWGDLLQ